ncbi:hypothetical protein GVY41_07430 [Frigidibacter albus]|uniref:Uncharacterized protein n=1 Tax=Frigidibacter albus TaxID=1465486 RepID=A0A6L8VFZ9_9RHOB|nr:hypothetical protein [Frigidibacter albus]MZQ89114.1 hypothetical protein [Frigidibacter albus]NBE30829.1 hypothetical protein [Frigidibacter albus]GGH51336.1 hypothetical protein GCM10011341_14920 [Frigidibacter albus]
MVKAGRNRIGGDHFAAARMAATRVWRGTGGSYADWPEALKLPAGAGRAASGWWIAAAAPFGLAAWAALGWLLFAS